MLAKNDNPLRPADRGTAGEADRSLNRHLVWLGALLGLLVGGMALAFALVEVSGAVVASGALVVDSQVKKVQHPSGGVVAQVLVKDGESVERGAPLVLLDDTVVRATLAAVTTSIRELEARTARLEAERDVAEQPAFPPDLMAAAQEDEAVARIVRGEARLFELRRAALDGQKHQLRERLAQLAQQITGLEEQRQATGTEISLNARELEGVRELGRRELVPATRLFTLEQQGARLRGTRGSLEASIGEARGKVSETELQIAQLDRDMRTEAARELADIRAKLSEQKERQVAALDQLKHIEVRAPQAGTVHELSIHTRGGVIQGGEQLMLIVPTADTLTAEVRVAPRDIDQIRLDQPAIVRFPNFNQRTTPEVTGNVARVSADIIADSRTGRDYYAVRVFIPAASMSELGGVTLVPGMPVDVFIRTDDRTILSYLTKPLTDQIARAFRER
ncbi:MAG: HlyD family type I secretion periplasmic adaptor subunit [Pseudomonadota bacterium]